MKKNFKIDQSNAILTDNRLYDLHNCYEFRGIVLDTKDKWMELLFEPSLEHGKGEPFVLLSFKDIDYLEFSPNFGSRTISGLDEMGYKTPEERDDNWLDSEEHATPQDHLFFRMLEGVNNDDFIRVHCRYAELIETDWFLKHSIEK